MTELVSILIPAWNAEKWIAETIKSALAQTWPKKEVIIVDDGSIDHTLKIARQFESKHVKVFTQENRGASAARNKAFEHAQGEYIQWLDSDDLLDFNKISEQMKIAESDRTGLTLYSSPFGTFYWRWQRAQFVRNALWQNLSPLDWLLNKFSKTLWMVPAVWLISRKIAQKAGPWDERLSLDDDGEYFCRVVGASKGIIFVEGARAYYRNSGFNQLNRNNSEKACRSLLLSTKLCIQHLRSIEDSQRTRKASRALLEGQWPFHYLEKFGQREEMKKLALELGCELMEPKLSWKEGLMNKIFGQMMGREIVTVLRKMRLASAVQWDKLLFKISESSVKVDRYGNKGSIDLGRE